MKLLNFKKIGAGQGFTLLETMVSLSIVVLMTGLFLANYHSTNQKATLNAAADQLVTDIRLVQSYALGAKKNNNVVPAGGWGLYFNVSSPNQYIIFTDDTGSHEYSMSDTTYRTVQLPTSVKIDTRANSGLFVNNNNSDTLSVVFSPPEPKTYIKRDVIGDDITHGQAQIKLIDGNNRNKTIFLNFFGMTQVSN